MCREPPEVEIKWLRDEVESYKVKEKLIRVTIQLFLTEHSEKTDDEYCTCATCRNIRQLLNIDEKAVYGKYDPAQEQTKEEYSIDRAVEASVLLDQAYTDGRGHLKGGEEK